MNFEELNSTKTELEEKVSALRADMKNKVGEYLVAHYKPLFDKYPNVYGISWTAYTPYFNDGSPCSFSSCHGDLSVISFIDGEPDEVDIYEHSKDITYEVGEEFSNHFPDISDDDMLSFFGDHVQVTLNRGGVEVDDYEHE